MSAGVRVEQSRPAGWTPAWRWLVAGCVAAVLVVETILLALGTGYFMGGFNSVYTEGAAGVGAYLASAALLDAALVLGVLAVAVPLLRRLGVGGLELLCSAALLAVALPLVPAVARYNLHVTLGRLVSVSLLQVGSAGSAVNAASVAVDEVPDYGRIAVGGLLLGSAGVLIFARRVGPRLAGRGVRFGPPAASRLWGSFLGLWVASAVVLVASALWVPILHFGLGNKSSGALLVDIVQRVTDLDRDGYGLLSLPADPAPLDATIHPYAVDLPGNGVDENGFGGDLPVGHVLPPPVAAAGAPAEATPHFLLIYLESFRADLLDQRLDGREITPFLNQLAAEGVRSEHAFVHSPWTLPSRAQLFAGSRTPPAAGPTLIDDFLERGYTVAYFSGQDDSYGDSVERLGADRADLFYDARADLERRTSRTTASVSLQVSWKTVLERVEAFLEGADPDRPHFLYVNLVDTHFPYHHDELDDILGVEPLQRSDIRLGRAQQVRAAYANSAANVDRAAGRLVAAWRERFRGRPQAILVTGDHGQSFYETGTLGHGQELRQAQARVPLVLWGIGGVWPEPLAPSDLRGLLDRNLFLARGEGLPRARLEPDPARRVFQYLGPLERPERLGLRGVDGLVVVDLRRGSAWRLDADESQPPGPAPEAEVQALIWSWETLQRRPAGPREP
jgi:hypothetical protein